jgi:hypothetical protein
MHGCYLFKGSVVSWTDALLGRLPVGYRTIMFISIADRSTGIMIFSLSGVRTTIFARRHARQHLDIFQCARIATGMNLYE